MMQAARHHWAAWLGAAAIALPLLSLTPYMLSGTEAARARNALVLDDTASASSDWSPPEVPPGFLVDSTTAEPMFVALAQRLHLSELPTDWERASAISHHLLGSSPTLRGGAIQADLATTYRRIVSDGDGYCVDFVRSFSAIAGAAGMPMRLWAFSFDGFGGHGHVFPEIWNRQAGRWQLIDVFNNAYFTIGGEPLSAREFRAAMLDGRTIRMHRLDPTARPGYIEEEKAWDYYRRGLPEWYLWWGNNPFSYDQAWSVRLFSPLSHSAAQLGAIVQGVQPHIQVLVTPENRARVDALRLVRWHLWGVLASVIGGLMLVLATLVRQRVKRRGEPLRRAARA